MEEMKDQAATAGNSASSASKLRYPLRSAARLREGRQAVAPETSGPSAARRGRPASDVSKSVNVLDLSSGKDKSAKPPRRLSVPSKSAGSPRPAPVGSITPISESQTRRSNTQGKSDTPVSDVSRTSSRRKFSVLSSVSYWLTQIKLAEAYSKHSISLGFFKLALESGCEPIQRLREELKSYAWKHNLIEDFGGPAKDLLQSYRILEDFDNLNISGACSQLPEDGAQISEADVHNSTAARTGNLRPRSLNSVSLVTAESSKLETVQKKLSAPKNKASQNKNPANEITAKAADQNGLLKKPQRRTNAGNRKSKNAMKKSPAKKDVSIEPLPAESSHDEKENVDVQQVEGSNLDEEICIA